MANNPDITHVYIGIKPCGCITAAIVDDPDDSAWTARRVRALFMEGKKVERISMAEYRELEMGCSHAGKQQQLALGGRKT